MKKPAAQGSAKVQKTLAKQDVGKGLESPGSCDLRLEALLCLKRIGLESPFV